ncbi:MAG: hypothetical protein JWM49_2042 [Microbacteriaceae bacterium]|nr:hypothetical protein [Microbacteriaceae bacterium]
MKMRTTAAKTRHYLNRQHDSGQENTRRRRETVSMATAVTLWQKLIRNSQHGFDTLQPAQSRALLASHNGTIPGDLTFLVWLHLLRVVTFPEILMSKDPRNR